MTTAQITKIIENQLAQGETEDAIQLLLALIDNKTGDWRAQAILLASQYRELKRNEMMGLEVNAKEINRINLSLLNLNAQINHDFSNENVPDSVITIARKYENTPKITASNKRKTEGINWRIWGMIAGILVAGFIGFKIYKTLTTKGLGEKNTPITQSQNEKSNDKKIENTTNTNTLSIGNTIKNVQPVFIDKKAKFRNYELLEIRYYPTDSDGTLVFDINYNCAYDIRGGCSAGTQNIELEIGDKKFNPNKIDFDKGRLSIIPCNSDGLMRVHFENMIPAGSQKAVLYVSENIFGVLEPMVNPAKIDIDLTKTKAAEYKPINWTFDTEKDFNMTKDIGYLKLLSVKAEPHNDDDFKMKVVFRKTFEKDFYNCCIRVMADNRLIGPIYKEIENNTKELEAEMSFQVPRTAQNLALMLGKCDTKSPFIVPILK